MRRNWLPNQRVFITANPAGTSAPPAARAHIVWNVGGGAALDRREAALVCAILAIAIAIRVPALLHDGLWRDQANIYVQLTAPNVDEYWRRVIGTEWHPPLFFFFMYFWAKAAGTSEIALELPPLIFSVATVAIVYLLGRAIGSVATAAVASAFYAVAPAAVAYSNEYLYPAMAFFSTLLALLIVCLRDRPLTPARFMTLALGTFFVVSTHYIALIYIPLLILWTVAYSGGARRRIGVAGALVAGALPFLLWLPVFVHQRQIGLPYQPAGTFTNELVFVIRTLLDFIPVRPFSLGVLFVALITVTLAALIRARALQRDALALGLIFFSILGFVTAQNLGASRYVLPAYGLACVTLASVLTRFRALTAVADEVAWRKWGALTAACLGILLFAADVSNAISSASLPKSGIRSIVHIPTLDAVTLYVLAPDYLAPTFAFYARHTRATFSGFVRWNRPEVFQLENYAADWNRADAVARTLRAIEHRHCAYTFLDVVADDFARDQGRVPYGNVQLLLHELNQRYRLLGRTRHPGRYEFVSEYRYLLCERKPRSVRF